MASAEKASFSYEKFLEFDNVAFSFIFDNYCLTID